MTDESMWPFDMCCSRCDEAARKAKLDAGGSFAEYICRFMIVCPDCGNKRCPKATFHDNPCSGSNAPNQPGSSYQYGPRLAAPVDLTVAQHDR
jgi:hypothetical protein